MKAKFLFLGLAAVMAVSTVVSSLSMGQGPAQMTAVAQPNSQSSQTALIPDVFIGADTAPVTIVEYGSFTCVHCGHFANEVFPSLKKEFIDTGKVRFSLREAYTDKFGLWAGALAYKISDGRTNASAYYDFVHDLYEKQSDWAFGSKDENEIGQKLRGIAAENDLSAEDAEKAFNDNDVVKSMVETFAVHAQEDKISATPTFIVNGVSYPNMPLEDFRDLIESELAKKE